MNSGVLWVEIKWNFPVFLFSCSSFHYQVQTTGVHIKYVSPQLFIHETFNSFHLHSYGKTYKSITCLTKGKKHKLYMC